MKQNCGNLFLDILILQQQQYYFIACIKCSGNKRQIVYELLTS